MPKPKTTERTAQPNTTQANIPQLSTPRIPERIFPRIVISRIRCLPLAIMRSPNNPHQVIKQSIRSSGITRVRFRPQKIARLRERRLRRGIHLDAFRTRLTLPWRSERSRYRCRCHGIWHRDRRHILVKSGVLSWITRE